MLLNCLQEYSDADYQNLTTYKLFQQTYRQRIQAVNPKVPQPKLMMLVAAKWREFQATNPASTNASDQVTIVCHNLTQSIPHLKHHISVI